MKRYSQQVSAAVANARAPERPPAPTAGRGYPWLLWVLPALFMVLGLTYLCFHGQAAVRYYYSALSPVPAELPAFFERPSGPSVDYLASLVGQYDAETSSSGWVALFEALMISVAAFLLFKKVAARVAWVMCMIPLGFWLVLQNDYGIQFHAVTLKSVIAVWCAWAAISTGPLMAAAIPLLGCVVFWGCGLIPALVFLSTIAGFSVLFRRWALLLAICLLVIVALFSSAVRTGQDLLSQLHWSKPGAKPYLTGALYLSVPAAVFFLALFKLRSAARPDDSRSEMGPRLPIPAVLVAQTAVFLATFAALWLTSHPREKAIVQLDDCARQGNWAGVLAAARDIPDPPAGTRLDIHRALFHSGGLGDTLFSVAQLKENSLIPNLLAGAEAYLPISEFWFEVGLVNAAQHYAGEALELRGPRPWILRQLARICLVKEQPLAARVYLSRLKTFRSQSEWAERMLAAIDAGVPPPDQHLNTVRQLGLTSDVLSKNWDVPEFLHQLLQANPTNRMAFDFLMAHYLLSFQLEQFVAEMEHFDALGAQHLPRYYEEALVLYREDPRGPSADPNRHPVSAGTAQRFAKFKSVLRQHGLKSPALEPALAGEFGDTLWFYYLFGHTGGPGASHPRRA